MRVFNFETNKSEEEIRALIEQMKGVLIKCFGKEYEGRICSILDDTNFLITKHPEMLSSFESYEEAIFERVNEVLPIRKYYKTGENEEENIIFHRNCLDNVSKILEYNTYEQLVRTYNEFESGGALTEKIKGDIADFYDNFIKTPYSSEQSRENKIKLTLKTFIDKYDFLIKNSTIQKYIYWKGLTYQDNLKENTWVANRLAYIYAQKSVLSEQQDEYMELIKNRDYQGLGEFLNIKKNRAENLVNWYKDICETLRKFNSSFTNNLNNFVYNSEFYKSVCRNELISRDEISGKTLSDFISQLKEMLFLDTKTVAFIQPLSNTENCAHRLFCVLKNNSSLSTITHEFIHLVSSSLARNKFFGGNDKYCDKVGFSVSNNQKTIGMWFDEFFTEYLSQKINDKVDYGCKYSKFIPIYEEFFSKYEKELKESFMCGSFDGVYKLFGKKNFLRALSYADELYETYDRYMGKLMLIAAKDVSPMQKRKIIEDLKSSGKGEKALDCYIKIKENLDKMAEKATEQEKN